MLKLARDVLDYTDVISTPSLWAVAGALRAFDIGAYLPEDQTALFLDAPDRFLQSPAPALVIDIRY